MKINSLQRRRAVAFTLIEMIGVLAVIAILAALLLPRVFEAINTARINNAVISYNTVKSAVVDHYGKYGKLNSLWGTNDLGTPLTNYDKTILVTEGLLDKGFTTKIAGGDPTTNSIIQLVKASDYAYYLDGSTTNTTTNGQFLVEAVLYNVSEADARAINDLLDGAALGAGGTTLDNKGRIQYTNSSGTVGQLHMYITHR